MASDIERVSTLRKTMMMRMMTMMSVVMMKKKVESMSITSIDGCQSQSVHPCQLMRESERESFIT